MSSKVMFENLAGGESHYDNLEKAKIRVEFEYFTGFYDGSQSAVTRLNQESVHCTGFFYSDGCLLKIYPQKKKHTVAVFKEPLDIFDLSIALLILKPVGGDMLVEDPRNSNPKNNRLLTITNVPGQGSKNNIFVFAEAKRARIFVQMVEEAQKRFGGPEAYDERSSGGHRKMTSDENTYMTELRRKCRAEETDPQDVMKDRVADAIKKVQDAHTYMSHMSHDLYQATSRCESRNEQIKLKQRDIADIKRKIVEAQPQRKYKYIIPFGHPHHTTNCSDQEAFISEENCRKLETKRREFRMKDWKRFEADRVCDTEVNTAELVKLARIENKKMLAGALLV